MELAFQDEMMRDDLEVQTELEVSGLDSDDLEFIDADEYDF